MYIYLDEEHRYDEQEAREVAAKVTANLETFIEEGMIKGKYYDIKLAINGIEYKRKSRLNWLVKRMK